MRRRYAWIDRQLVPLFAPNFHPATPIALIPMPPPGRELDDYVRRINALLMGVGLPWVYPKPLAPPAPVAVTAPKPVE